MNEIEPNHFKRVMGQHLIAKMKREKLSFDQVAKKIGVPNAKNYLFRAAKFDDDDSQDVKVPEKLLALLNWLELEPRDFVEDGFVSKEGHVETAVLALDLMLQQKRQLLDVIRAFLRSAAKT